MPARKAMLESKRPEGRAPVVAAPQLKSHPVRGSIGNTHGRKSAGLFNLGFTGSRHRREINMMKAAQKMGGDRNVSLTIFLESGAWGGVRDWLSGHWRGKSVQNIFQKSPPDRFWFLGECD